MVGIAHRQLQNKTAFILVTAFMILAAIGIGVYSYLEKKGFNNPKGEVPTQTLNNTEGPLPTPEGVEGWKETTIEPRNLYKFQFPSEFEIWDYNPAITYVQTDDYIRIGVEERIDGENVSFDDYAVNTSKEWLESQSDNNTVVLEAPKTINSDLSIMGYYDPGREVATTIGPRYVLLANVRTEDYPIRIVLTAHCNETGYSPKVPFELIAQNDCTTRDYSELRDILLEIASTIQSV